LAEARERLETLERDRAAAEARARESSVELKRAERDLSKAESRAAEPS
jgi:hypothetical protein